MGTKTKPRKLKSLKHIRKLSTLLAFALKDLRKQERTKGCVVDMGTWWRPKSELHRECVACLAGSVMRWSLYKPRVHSIVIYPHNYDDETAERLAALNAIRGGNIEGAAQHIGVTSAIKFRPVAIYDSNDKAFWSDMKQLLADLRAAGE